MGLFMCQKTNNGKQKGLFISQLLDRYLYLLYTDKNTFLPKYQIDKSVDQVGFNNVTHANDNVVHIIISENATGTVS